MLRYAARAIDLSGSEGSRLEAGLLDRLARAESTRAGAGTGRDLYMERVKSNIPATARVAAGWVAARQLASAPDAACRAAHQVREEAGSVTVQSGRTGRDTTYRVSFNRLSGARVGLNVSGPEGLAARLEQGELPECYRFPVVAALRAEVIARQLTADERAQIAMGSTEASTVVGHALVRAVGSLERDQSPEAVAAIIDLADLLDLHGLHVPFDAQTAFERIRRAAPPDVAGALAPVAARLGFTTEG